MMNAIEITIANFGDLHALNIFLQRAGIVHRHLDWRNPRDWLGYHPYLFLKKNSEILAVLSCPVDPPPIAWIRIFALSKNISINEAWEYLFHATLNYFRESKTEITLAAVAINKWFEKLLIKSRFEKFQEIIVMERYHRSITMSEEDNSVDIRKMNYSDLSSVEMVDRSAFPALWQLSIDGLSAAFRQSDYSTVAFFDDDIVGYQICTANLLKAHLARIGVREDYQGKGVGSALLLDALYFFSNLGYLSMSVNTQEDNLASISLYKKFNFECTGEKFPVFIKKVNFVNNIIHQSS